MSHACALDESGSISPSLSSKEFADFATPSPSPSPNPLSKKRMVHSLTRSSDSLDRRGSDATMIYHPLSPKATSTRTELQMLRDHKARSYSNHKRHRRRRSRNSRHGKYHSFSSSGKRHRSQMSMSSLSLLEEDPTHSQSLPSPILTKMNATVWNMNHFDEYEKQLKDEISALKESHQKLAESVAKHHQKDIHSPRVPASQHSDSDHAAISKQNSHLWSAEEMQNYQTQLLAQMNHYLEQ